MRRYLLNMLLALDQSWNAYLGGNVDETLSSRVGKAAIAGKRWALVAEFFIDCIFRALGQKGHCRASIEWDEVAK